MQRLKTEIVSDNLVVTHNQKDIFASIKGTFVVGGNFPGKPRLRLYGRDFDGRIEFSGKRSSKIASRFPDASNAQNARILPTKVEYYHFPLQLFVETEDGKKSEFLRTLDVPQLVAARDLALIKLYKNHVETGQSERIFVQLRKMILSRKSSLTNIMARAWLYGMFDKRPRQLAIYLSTLKQKFDELERFKAFEAFEEEMLAEGIKLQSPHGGFDFLAAQNSDDLWKAYDTLAGELKLLGLKVFLNSGTLLGAIRDGDFLPHDDDIDVAVILNADNDIDAGKEFSAIRALLQKKQLLDEHGKHSAGILKLRRINGVQVDLFPAWISRDDQVYVYPHTYGTVAKGDLLDLKIWKGLSNTLIPSDPAPLLASNYGENWKIPDPYFRFHWAKSRRQFKDFLAQLQDTPND
ncbi:LicD family protein [Celeribacter sp.]|uniref:LicD family protein n=1 Tax=Celeribacter sp. TaxID=1890673 RepID=UPI003A95541B